MQRGLETKTLGTDAMVGPGASFPGFHLAPLMTGCATLDEVPNSTAPVSPAATLGNSTKAAVGVKGLHRGSTLERCLMRG